MHTGEITIGFSPLRTHRKRVCFSQEMFHVVGLCTASPHDCRTPVITLTVLWKDQSILLAIQRRISRFSVGPAERTTPCMACGPKCVVAGPPNTSEMFEYETS